MAVRWTKKGIAITASKWTMKSAQYQIGATLCAYADGTVHVGTGGVEMGQGLNTKVALCVTHELGIDYKLILVEGADTNTLTNCAVTGGSGTSESCCNAAIKAASQLNEVLGDYKTKGLSFQQAVGGAKMAGKNLSTIGWCVQPRTFSSSSSF